MSGTTISSLLQKDIVESIRDTCGKEAPGFEAPKSRRVIADRDREIRYVPGWVKLTEKS
ncbi:hypothetical protein H1P_70047 [Hyella patelloides LEGE 07179]|uniref:Uncharacterized protein n=1 Tax=Hyella patelloides LEGE 07179 TaxID=945734 RepID=A0A563W380_9CYAN|nr:hypothetical protein [Hyella patelloides]VEP18164.1 hypothetical protein H1P_70047 [Hyella patelloides LEGE 07179]